MTFTPCLILALLCQLHLPQGLIARPSFLCFLLTQEQHLRHLCTVPARSHPTSLALTPSPNLQQDTAPTAAGVDEKEGPAAAATAASLPLQQQQREHVRVRVRQQQQQQQQQQQRRHHHALPPLPPEPCPRRRCALLLCALLQSCGDGAAGAPVAAAAAAAQATTVWRQRLTGVRFPSSSIAPR
jgi:hypothetical protein